MTWAPWCLQTHDSPLEMWGFKGIDQPNALPHSPLLFTKGRCGTAKNTRVIELSNGTVVSLWCPFPL